MFQSDAYLSQSIESCTLRLRRRRDGREFELELESESEFYHQKLAALLDCDIVEAPKAPIPLWMIPLEALAPALVLFAVILVFGIGTPTFFSPDRFLIIQNGALASLGFWSVNSIVWIGLRLAVRTRA